MVHRVLVNCGNQPMPNENETTELSKIAKLNGDFRKNYGLLLGAFLYLRSISAARARPLLWTAATAVLGSALGSWLIKHGLNWVRMD
jgi:hypothetical protein